MSYMKIVFAKELDSPGEFALIIKHESGKYLGGVASIESYEYYINVGPMLMKMSICWRWWRYVDPMEFEASRGWESPQLLPAPTQERLLA
jgi:hypothetical protein